MDFHWSAEALEHKNTAVSFASNCCRVCIGSKQPRLAKIVAGQKRARTAHNALRIDGMSK